jgi:hypothetical protein
MHLFYEDEQGTSSAATLPRAEKRCHDPDLGC